MTLVSSTIDRLRPPDVRRDPREELCNMALRADVRGIFEKSLAPGVTLADDSAPDPYDDSPTPLQRAFSVIRANPRELVLLQIPDWIANDGRSVGALDETRFAFRGKTVRIVSEDVLTPAPGLETMAEQWTSLEKIDTAFVSWRRVLELKDGRLSVARVLKAAWLAAPGSESGVPRPAPSAAPRVFISYAHADRPWQEMLMKQLSPLTDKYGGAIWSDNELEAGDDWMTKIVDALSSSPIVVLLISPSFIASKFIKAHEFGVALKAANEKKKTLLWVYVTTCPFEAVGIGAFQAAHDIVKPLDQLPLGDQWAQLDKVYRSLAKALAELE